MVSVYTFTDFLIGAGLFLIAMITLPYYIVKQKHWKYWR